jgi:hypothetical protein
MAGRENQGDLWVLSLCIDLQPLIVCADFRTLSLVSFQILGHRDLYLMTLAQDGA